MNGEDRTEVAASKLREGFDEMYRTLQEMNGEAGDVLELLADGELRDRTKIELGVLAGKVYDATMRLQSMCELQFGWAVDQLASGHTGRE